MPRFARSLAASLVALCCVAGPAALAAQPAAPATLPAGSPVAPAATDRATLSVSPAVGSLVRVTFPAPSANARRPRFEGTLVMLERDSLRVFWRTGDSSNTIALADVHRLEVSLGRRRQVLRSIGMGTLIGAGSLAVVTLVSHDDTRRCSPDGWCDWFYISRGEAATMAGIVGAVGGAVVGGIVGTVRTTERWHTIARGSAPGRVAVTPQLGRSNGVRVRVAF